MTASLLVAEVFGPTVQGEGASLGRRASFIRLGACNLACTWCDTPYTWDRTRYDLRAEMTTRPAVDVLAEVIAHDTPLVVITGGEPLLQQHRSGWVALVEGLLAAGRDVEVETNGTLRPLRSWPGVTFNVSPKLAFSGGPAGARIVPDALRAFAGLAIEGRAVFKFVGRGASDVAAVVALVGDHGLPWGRVWVMPEGVTADALAGHTAAIADAVVAAGFNLTTRLHVQAWGQERKR